MFHLKYLLRIPRYENANILGANWLTTEWDPLRQLVCCTGDAGFIPLSKKELLSASQSLMYTSEPDIKKNILTHSFNCSGGKYVSAGLNVVRG